jgi:hypothetical protein
MKTLLEFIVQYVQFLYLNPAYRFTDSKNRGLAEIDASITLTGEQIGCDIVNERGRIYFAVVPVRRKNAENWFWLSLIQQYLEGGDDTGLGTPIKQAEWLSNNLSRVEQLFADDSTTDRVCEELIALRRSNSYKTWGWPKPDEPV